MNWLIVGSSPSAACAAQHWADSDVRVAVSSALTTLKQRPDIFITRDIEAVRRFKVEILQAEAAGTKIVMDEFVGRRAPNPPPAWWEQVEVLVCRTDGRFVRGQYVHVSYSGALAVQYAVNNGAKRVVITGLEGYGTTTGSDEQQRDNLRQIVCACPDVEFVFHGHYEPFWRLCSIVRTGTGGESVQTPPWPPGNWELRSS